MKIFEALRKDHDKQRALIKLLLDTKGESATRKEYFTQLKAELALHAVAEERHFYAPLMQADQTAEFSRHGVAQHHQIDNFIARLNSTRMSSSAWLSIFKQLAEKVEHHLTEEEHKFFQPAGKVLSEEQKTTLAHAYVTQMQK